MLKVHRYTGPLNKTWYGEPTELDDFNFDNLRLVEVDTAWYWYTCSGYEGSGQLLMRRDGRFHLHDMGHCSCNGPTDITIGKGFASLDGVRRSATDDLLEDIEPLLKMAEETLSREEGTRCH